MTLTQSDSDVLNTTSAVDDAVDARTNSSIADNQTASNSSQTRNVSVEANASSETNSTKNATDSESVTKEVNEKAQNETDLQKPRDLPCQLKGIALEP